MPRNQDLNRDRDLNCETVWEVLKQYFSFRTAQEGRYSLSDYLGASFSSIQSPSSTLCQLELKSFIVDVVALRE
ncbi:hypothetical protein DPMN_120685 [Dreissena polymorpha]|uniref:Uncharacterized protein n=1 Tax=Dreissena polymorpha TaxID=45954 RepID=A0A9D4GS24_DREPO|nr:hypothetical protein DPMN_120685 [Dreissena polymorpha]